MANQHNLPAELTPLIGRQRELDRLAEILGTARLLTLVGPGGVGKTRLALATAAATVAAYADGTWLVDLAPVDDPTLVLHKVAWAVNLRQRWDAPLEEVLAERLRDRHLLLVLDNCEHLVQTCAVLAERLLRACPGLTILATSREPLGVAGECLWPFVPLELPGDEEETLPPPEQLMGYAAVQLFVERARAGLPDFALTPGTAADVVEICRRLDGLPLAIELAAARVRLLGLAGVTDRLGNVLGALVGPRTAPARQQTLRGALDWSCRLLSRAELVLLERLSVFAGGWTLAAAEAVCGWGEVPAEDILDLLTRLVDKSLVVAQPLGPAVVARYLQLEIVRQYAAERLGNDDRHAEMQARHASCLVRFAEDSAPELIGPQVRRAVDRLNHEYDNFRAAFRWLLEHDHAAPGLQMAVALFRFWLLRGYLGEARQWLSSALHLASDVEPVLMAQAVHASGTLAAAQGDSGPAERDLRQAVELWRALGNFERVGAALANLGHLACNRGDFERAAEWYAESEQLRLQQGDVRGLALIRESQGRLARLRGQLEQSAALLIESQRLYTAAGDHYGVANSQSELGATALACGDARQAAHSFAASLSTSWTAGLESGLAENVEGLATAEAARGGLQRSVRLLAAAERLRDARGTPRASVDSGRWSALVERVRLTGYPV